MQRQRRPSQYQPWGPKLPQVQNLGGCFVVFFLGDQNRNFEEVRGLKLQLSLKKSKLVYNLKEREYRLKKGYKLYCKKTYGEKYSKVGIS